MVACSGRRLDATGGVKRGVATTGTGMESPDSIPDNVPLLAGYCRLSTSGGIVVVIVVLLPGLAD